MFFREEYPAIVRTVSVLAPDQAEDLAQEAFARAYARWSKVSRYESPGGFVRRVALNLAVSQRRRKTPEVVPGDPPAGSDLDLRRAIDALPRNQRIAVVLHYFEDRAVADVATVMGWSTSTAKTHLHRARMRLGELLDTEASDVDR